jgi:2-polyprenyl-3-methyl-5-hydroxy-6-metoxy-1,4-benzoquinol methylase
MKVISDDQAFSNDQALKYQNAGNTLLLQQVIPGLRIALDVGCGCGDNARHLISRFPGLEVIGITASPEEAQIAQRYIKEIHIANLDSSDLTFLEKCSFDLVVLSHVLEHLKEPTDLVRRLTSQLKPGGQMLIAVPNILQFKNRLRLLLGRFEYEDTGIMDRTHLRFFTWRTAERYLISPVSELKLVTKVAEGSIPLWPLRRLIPQQSRALDEFGTRLLPNLFGGQIVMDARRKV